MEPHTLTNYISIRGLWPEGLAIAIGAAYILGMKYVSSEGTANLGRVRMLSLLGFLACAYLVYLGLYPSIFSFAALLVMPAILVFLVLTFRPALISNWPRLRIYATGCVALSILCALSEMLWLVNLRWR